MKTKKTFNEDALADELRPGSAFFPPDAQTKKFESPDSQRTRIEEIPSSDDVTLMMMGKPDIQIAKQRENEVIDDKENQRTPSSESQSTGEPEKQLISYLRKKRPDRKSQLVYLPPALIKRLKRHAVDTDREISEVAADALTEYLERHPS